MRSTFKFMVFIGVLMGVAFPFYSYLFFGGSAFAPLYVLGCLTAGFVVGTLCYFVVKQVLRLHVATQWETLRRFPGAAGYRERLDRAGDELETLVRCRDDLIARVLALVESVTSITQAIHPHYERLLEAAGTVASQNERQVSEVHKSLHAVEGMKGAFAGILGEVEAIASCSEARTSISAQMSRSADEIADGMERHADMVLTTSGAIEEIAANLRRSRADVEELHASTEQTSASIMQITAAIAEVRDFSQKTKEFSEGVQGDARDGMRAVQATLETMRGIEATTEESCAAIDRLSVHTAQVGSVLATIRDVAEQTNLLSLNAAIIAAQAGRSGSAFTVVAGEVRKLALRTAGSTKEIAELVRNIQAETQAVERAVTDVRKRVGEGVQVSQGANASLTKIARGAEEASQRVRKIADATVDQAVGSGLISEEAAKNLERLNRVTRAVQEQERTSLTVVGTLENLRAVSQTMTASLQQMAAGNHQYLQGVMADRDRAQELRGTAQTQLAAGESVVAFVKETERLVETNATEAGLIVQDIEAIAKLTAQLLREVATLEVAPGSSPPLNPTPAPKS